MASNAFTVWTSQAFTPASPLVAGVPTTLAMATFSNAPTQRPSVVLTVDYEAVTPDITNGLPPFALSVAIETEDANGNWTPVAYQFSEWRNTEQPSKRIIRMQPDASDFNAGIDDSIFIGQEVARISRNQGYLPEGDFRVRLIVVDSDPEGPNAFQSVTVSAAGARYDNV